ncbi:DUF5787 family protein [Haloarchaeobius sp. HRN-SO-5]|uniref:DUF5787 family protein n=1 Tax=Haloarchaeobius sp. HRN-SO-5 TaxID=3446118 RepID=UPI003EBF1C0A
MREFGFEQVLCATLERDGDDVLARQLGGGVHDARRVLDVVCVEPGPSFDERAAITDRTIPHAAIESDVGRGRARDWRRAVDMPTERARGVVERAVDVGFFERDPGAGPEHVRRTCRYPSDWFDRLVAIENKPDLGAPGDLETQLRKDVRLGLVDEVVLATASYVTGAHLNRIPEQVGVWEFDPETLDRTVVRDPTPLPVDEPGVELVDEHPGWTEVGIATAGAKARARRRLAERAYGKGWRVCEFPGCARVRNESVAGGRGVPHCEWKGRVVDPGNECGPECPGFRSAEPPSVDVAGERDRRTAWVQDPDGRARRQAGLDRFS